MMVLARLSPQSFLDYLLSVLTALTLYSGALQVSLYLFLGLAPVLGNALFAAAAIVVVIFVISRAVDISIDFSFFIISGFWAFYLCWATLSASWAVSLDVAGDKLLNLVGYSSAFYLIGLAAGRSSRVLDGFRYTTMALGGVTFGAALLAASRGTGNLVAMAKQHGALAIFVNSYQSTTLCVGMASVFALIEFVSAAKRYSTIAWGLAWGTLSLATLAGGGRGAAIGCALAQLGILIFSLVRGAETRARSRAIGVLATLPAILTGAILIALELQLRTITRLANFASTSTDSTGRLTLWRRAMTMAEQHPFFGAGIGSYEATANNFVNPGLYPHNMFIETLTETGVVGFFLMVAVVAIAIICVFNNAGKIRFIDMAVWLSMFVVMLVEANVSGTVTDRFLVFSLGMSAGLISKVHASRLGCDKPLSPVIGPPQFGQLSS